MDTIRQWAIDSLASRGVPMDIAGVTVAIVLGFIYLILIFFVVKLVLRLSSHLIDRMFRQKIGLIVNEKRMATLPALLKSIIFYVVYFVAAVTVLETVFNIKTQGILAGAGVLGLAIGFGSQSLVKDVITGFFILFEDQFAVGDFVVIGTKEGIVEEMGLRVTKIRSWKGDLFIIPNGEIKEVTNKSRGGMLAVVEVGVAYEEDVDQVVEVVNELGQQMWRETPEIFIEAPGVLGVVNLDNNSVVLRVTARTIPMEQWAMERKLRQRIKKAFDEKGIEIPYPRQVNVSYDLRKASETAKT